MCWIKNNMKQYKQINTKCEHHPAQREIKFCLLTAGHVSPYWSRCDHLCSLVASITPECSGGGSLQQFLLKCNVRKSSVCSALPLHLKQSSHVRKVPPFRRIQSGRTGWGARWLQSPLRALTPTHCSITVWPQWQAVEAANTFHLYFPFRSSLDYLRA